MSAPTCSRAVSTAFSAVQPKMWLRLAALPKSSREVRQHRLEHARIDRRRRVVVHVDRELERHFEIPATSSGARAVVAVDAAGAALGLGVGRLAGAAAVHVGQRLVEIADQPFEPRDRLLGLAQLVREDLAHAVHRLGRRVRLLPVAEERLDLGQREAEVLQLLDPLDALDRLARVEAEAPLRADGRRRAGRAPRRGGSRGRSCRSAWPARRP